MKIIRWTLLLVLLAILLPYLFSRLLSPQRRVRIRQTEVSNATEVSAAGDATEPRAVRIACYNIAHGRGLAESNWTGESAAVRQERLTQIAIVLRDLDADVVVLNEVDFDCSWSHHANQAEELARLAGYKYRVELRNLDFRILGWTWRFGNAVLSRHPIADANVLDLPALKTWEAWLAGKKRGVVCQIKRGDQEAEPSAFFVMAVHLSHRSEALRVASAEMLVDETQRSELPVVLAGDFNSTPAGFPQSVSTAKGANAIATLDESQRFQRRPMSAPDAGQLTFHATSPRSVIDWILISPGAGLDREPTFRDYGVVASELSDHRPIFAEIQFDVAKP